MPETDIGIPDAVKTALSPLNKRPRSTIVGLKYLEGRQLLQTRQGRFGYTKRGVMPGDQVCLITGLPVFHVLRDVSEETCEEQHWKLVGDAYVHSLMYGEVDQLDIEERDIILA